MKKIILLLCLLAFVGCSKAEPVSPKPGAEATHHGHEVDGWCVEHGIPEKICSQCNSKVAADYKKEGDWCQEHNRAESQCFICNPANAEKFVAQYEAQYGKKPPQAVK